MEQLLEEKEKYVCLDFMVKTNVLSVFIAKLKVKVWKVNLASFKAIFLSLSRILKRRVIS